MSTFFKKLILSVGMTACCGCLLAATGCSHPNSQAQTDSNSATVAIAKDPTSDPRLNAQQKAQIEQYMAHRQTSAVGATTTQ